MTEEEEFRLFYGPWPWRLPGLFVNHRGVRVVMPPRDRPKFSQPVRIHYMGREKWKEVWEDYEALDPQELHAQISLARDQLSEEWMRAKRRGEKVERRFEQFRDWVGERIGPQADTGPTSESKDEADANSLIRPDIWHEVIRPKSHIDLEEGFEERVEKLNRIRLRYMVLRKIRRAEVFGSSEKVVPPQTEDFAELAAKEFEEEGVETQTGVCRGVAAQVDDAERRTVERWLIDRNPHYESLGDSQSRRYEALKQAVESVNQQRDR